MTRSRLGLGLLTSLLLVVLAPTPAHAEDAQGCIDHGVISRYPNAVLSWCKTDNYLPFRIPVGPVTGYRAIGEWLDVEGRVTRNFYSLTGGERTHPEVWKNYRDALVNEGFEIIAEGLIVERNVKGEIGGGTWLGVYYMENPWGESGPVNKLVSGTATSGGTGAVFARKRRADDTIYVLVSLEQHSSNEVATLVTVVETQPAQSGLITADAEAMGKDILENGRTVLHGLYFEHDKAVLTDESADTLSEIAKLLSQMPDKRFYIVGHTDATGAFGYNMQLSTKRAEAVRLALVKQHQIAGERLQGAGVGPLSPIYSNGAEAGRKQNRRVELVER